MAAPKTQPVPVVFAVPLRPSDVEMPEEVEARILALTAKVRADAIARRK